MVRKNIFNGWMSRKSQMEIMGLMIVVILLIIGVLFAVKFVVLKEQPQTRQEYTRTQMAANLGMAMLESTTANCRGTSIKDLLIDCANWPGGTITCQDGRPSCVYVNDTIEYILNETLIPWNVKFQIKAWSVEGDYLFIASNLGCNDNKPGESESFFLPTDVGLLNFKIYICS